MKPISANFDFLGKHDAQLVRLAALAERYFKDDPNTCLIKLRQFGEVLAQLTAAKAGLFSSPEEQQTEPLRRLKFDRVLPDQAADIFHQIRIVGNRATHGQGGIHAEALTTLKLARTWSLVLPDVQRSPFFTWAVCSSTGPGCCNQGVT